jgi:hypothetical protein
MDVAQVAKELAMKHGKALALDLVNLVIFEALEEAAKKSSTPYDDIAVAALKQPLKDALLAAIEKL